MPVLNEFNIGLEDFLIVFKSTSSQLSLLAISRSCDSQIFKKMNAKLKDEWFYLYYMMEKYLNIYMFDSTYITF